VSKKSVWTLIGALAIVSLLIVGCAPEAAPPAGEEEEAAAPEEEEETAPAAPTEEVFEWVGQSHAGGITQQHHSLQRVGEQIEAASGGRLKMVVEVGGGIAPASKEFDAVDSGVLDFAVTCFMYWMDKFPTAGIFTMVSGGMSPMEAMIWFREGGGSDLADEMVAGYDVQILRNGGWMGPPEVFLQTNKELKKAGDLKGLKIRGAGDGAEILSLLGAGMVMMPAGEIFESMTRGTIDAFECASPTLNWDLGLNEVGDYLWLSGARQPYEYNPFIVNADRWAELPDDLKAIVSEVNQAETIRAYAELIRLDLEALENFRDYGTVVRRLPAALEEEYSAAARGFYADKAAGDPFAAEILESYFGFQETFGGTWAKP